MRTFFKVRIPLRILLLLLIFLLSLFFYKQKYFQKFWPEKSNLEKKEIFPSMELKDVTLIGREKGEKKWEISTEKVLVSKDQRYTYFLGVKKASFFQKGKEIFFLKAKEAVYDNITKNLEIKNDVFITTKKNLCVKTKNLIWDYQRKKFFTNEPVKITWEKNFLLAKKFVADANLDIIELSGDINLQLDLKKIKEET